jgi:NADH:ubiquinone oxidoreductase subunit 3 (subunit A)
MDFVFVLAIMGLGVVFVAGGLVASRLLAPYRPGGQKNEPYECGAAPVGPAWVQFNVAYYLTALLFLVFDVEAAFLYPWAVVFREVGLVGLIEAFIFVMVVLVALVYAWRKGVLEWV